MTVLTLVQTGWVVDETPLEAGGFQAQTAEVVDDGALTFIGVSRDEKVDGGYLGPPITGYAMFFIEPGGTPQLLTQSKEWLRIGTRSGTGITLMADCDGGVEISRLRGGEQPQLVSLGVFAQEPTAVTCDDAVRDCLIVPEAGDTERWHADGGRSVFASADVARIDGAAMHPDGGWVALSMQQNAVLVAPGGAMTVFRAALEWKAKTFEEVVAPKNVSEERFERISAQCVTAPFGWTPDAKLMVGQSGQEDIGAEACPVATFEYDPVTRKRRTPKDSYPWNVLDCPKGGWTSRVGTFVTECEEEIRRLMRPVMPRGPGREEEPPDLELPEAVALSPTEIFVMAKPRPKKWKWYAPGASLKGKGLDFVLAGPSVVTFKKNGVVVEAVTAWKYEGAIFVAPLADDWHLITAAGRPHLVRLRHVD